MRGIGPARRSGGTGRFLREHVTYIYGLYHPETGELRYIGKANDVSKRLESHLREMSSRNRPLHCWMRTLGGPPRILVLEEVSGDWKDAERRLIAEYREKSRLLNVADGGDEPYCSKEVRANNGRKTASMIHSDARRRRIWEIKRALGLALVRGEVSEKTKALMRNAASKHPSLLGGWATI